MGNTLKCFIFFTFRDGPWGGCNQFLKALRNELQATGHWADTPESADVILLDSFNEAHAVLALKKRFPKTPFVQRMDGPISLYRGKDLHVDRLIHTISATIPDGVIFQSHYSRNANLSLKMPPPRHSTVILNAANHEHFHRGDHPAGGGRIKIIATSWSSNRNKGFDVYTYLDQHLDFTRYSMTFVGNSPVTFTNIHHEPPKTTAELAQFLRRSDMYVSASRHESCSNSLLEALACGLPSVVIRSGGNPEILGRGGELFSGTNDVIPAIEKVSASLMQYKENITPRSIVDVSREYVAFFEKVCEASSMPKKLEWGGELKLRLRLAQWRFLSLAPHWHAIFRGLVRNSRKA